MITLIIGCGKVGLRLAAQLQAAGPCYGLIRNPERIPELTAHKVQPWLQDLDQTLQLPVAIRNADPLQILYLAPPGRTDLTDRRIATVINALPKPPTQWVYISTSGVYGDCNGRWVDETTPVNPLTDRAKRRVSAEQQLLDWGRNQQAPVIILRVPGIYGPGRLPLQRIRSGEPIIDPAVAPVTNLIHEDDLVAVCIAALQRGRAGEIYNVSGGEPINISEYYLAVAAAAGLPVPEYISLQQAQQQFSPQRLSFINESRRLDCRKLHRELQPLLRYADINQGIRASLADE